MSGSGNERGSSDPLLTTRGAVILLIAAIFAAISGMLVFLSEGSIPRALLAAGATLGGSVMILNAVIGP
jgi:hypothetical protein